MNELLSFVDELLGEWGACDGSGAASGGLSEGGAGGSRDGGSSGCSGGTKGSCTLTCGGAPH